MAKIKKGAATEAVEVENIEVPPMATMPTPSVKSEEDDPEESGNRYKRLKKWLARRYEFRRNGLTYVYEVRQKGQPDWKTIDEDAFASILFEAGFVGFEKMFKAIFMGSDLSQRYDPIDHYFNEIIPKYDGKTDYIKQLLSYITLKDESLRDSFEVHFTKALCRTAAQALGSLRFNKQCLLFHGGQGDGKTSFMRNLMPSYLNDYRFDQFDIDNKDHRIAMVTTFIINIDDLDRIKPQSLGNLKSQFSKDFIQERVPYGRRTESLRRRASFWGTTNKTDFLIDETGSQRWIIFEIKNINHDNGGKNGYTSVKIDNVWSQVYALVKSGYKYEVDRAEMEASEVYNRRYQKTSLEMELVEKFFAPSSKAEFMQTKDGSIVPMQASEIMMYIDKQYAKPLNLNEEKIGRALAWHKFEREQYYIASKKSQRYGYFVRLLTPDMEITPDDIVDDEPTDDMIAIEAQLKKNNAVQPIVNPSAKRATSYRADKKLLNQESKENGLVVMGATQIKTDYPPF